MSLAPRISVLLLLLSACAAPMTPPAEPTAATMQQEPSQMSAKLEALLDATLRLRVQYDALGETLKWQEGEIAALREAARVQPKIIVSTDVKKSEEPIKKEMPADVGSLTEQDLQPIRLSPEAPADTAAHASPASEAQTPAPYYVHVASVADQGSAAKGWAEFQKKHMPAFGQASAVTTSFTDKKGKTWQRLWAGPYASADAANAACTALKKKGSWCEVLPLADSLVTKLP